MLRTLQTYQPFSNTREEIEKRAKMKPENRPLLPPRCQKCNEKFAIGLFELHNSSFDGKALDLCKECKEYWENVQ